MVPPTDVRVLRMLQGTTREADEKCSGLFRPISRECTVEKVAINAVMAGCKPEYLPVVLAAVEAALEPAFTLHGLLATTYFSGADHHRQRADRETHRHEFAASTRSGRATAPTPRSAARCS